MSRAHAPPSFRHDPVVRLTSRSNSGQAGSLAACVGKGPEVQEGSGALREAGPR